MKSTVQNRRRNLLYGKALSRKKHKPGDLLFYFDLFKVKRGVNSVLMDLTNFIFPILAALSIKFIVKIPIEYDITIKIKNK